MLGRILGHRLEQAKGTRFSMDFQSLQEKAQKKGRQPKGRALLWHVLAKHKLERDRGTCLTQHHLLSLKISGKDVKALENFRTKCDFVFNSLEKDERPSEGSLRTPLFEELKEHPLMLLQIDKFQMCQIRISQENFQMVV